jgi:hypothetical protein
MPKQLLFSFSKPKHRQTLLYPLPPKPIATTTTTTNNNNPSRRTPTTTTTNAVPTPPPRYQYPPVWIDTLVPLTDLLCTRVLQMLVAEKLVHSTAVLKTLRRRKRSHQTVSASNCCTMNSPPLPPSRHPLPPLPPQPQFCSRLVRTFDHDNPGRIKFIFQLAPVDLSRAKKPPSGKVISAKL